MNAIDMIITCIKHQPLRDMDGIPIGIWQCVTCGHDVMYNWYRNRLCAACDMKRELSGEVDYYTALARCHNQIREGNNG